MYTLHSIYYEFGFINSFENFSYRFKKNKLISNNYNFCKATAFEYKEIRDKYYCDNGDIVWDEEAINYAIKWNEYYGGKTEIVESKTNNDSISKWIIMYHVNNKTLYITETTLYGEQLDSVINLLMEMTNTYYAEYTVSGGMARFFDKKDIKLQNGYFNLTLG